MNFTDRGIKGLTAREKSYEIFSSDRSGFAIRISPKGLKTWFTRYRNKTTGKQVKVTLGNYPEMSLAEARIKHNEKRALLHEGKDPRQIIQTLRQDEIEAGTVAELVEEYIERHAKIKKKSWAEDLRILNKDVIPNWADRKAKDISRRDIIDLLDTVVDRGSPISANNLHARLSKMFKFGVRRGLLDTSPFVEIELPSKRTSRDRVLSEEEIRIFWNRLEDANTHIRIKLALKLLLITGQRRGELALARKEEFDLQNAIWTIPAERCKNGLSHRVPLSEIAIRTINQLIENGDGSTWLIPSPFGYGQPFTLRAISRSIRNNRDYFDLPRFTPHDLRRTAASHMTGLGIPRLVVSKILNHVETGITAVYDRHGYDNEKRGALELWGKRLETII